MTGPPAETRQEQDDMPSLGPCCGCGTITGVRNIMMLSKKAAIPGHGWGCVVCGLPSDGAVVVLCDSCCEGFEQRPPREACRGYPAEDGRMPYAELIGTHEHDMTFHQDERSGGLPAIPGATPWKRFEDFLDEAGA